ncbi:granaticin polyketide synthase ketoacyl reductase 2 [Fusarium heterosporum]|uniref:Granaticin polyketide synthase ketoacyl reductase 2 n=1 Tax=Fusarium heterosporum TaxID=42747 RepID=A0A8H5WZ34_FUSHE|nr:granaticin polyketide synthase ketoacyl reductase 2 [Fusarium heterosporum]
MTFSIPDSVVLITAGTSGLGLCVADKLIRAGARVVVNYASNEERANSVVDQLRKTAAEYNPNNDNSTRCLAIKADVSKKTEIQQLVDETVAIMGKIDAIVSNAGWTKFADFFDLDDNVDEEVWDQCYAANVKAHLFLCHAAKKYLEDAHGAFIMTSSIAGVKPSGSSMAYAVTKAAQLHLSKSLAMVMAPSVRVNAVSPGFMETNWIAGFPQSKIEDAREKTLLKRITRVQIKAVQNGQFVVI